MRASLEIGASLIKSPKGRFSVSELIYSGSGVFGLVVESLEGGKAKDIINIATI